ncbi:unnamed protein product [Arabidopsis halleri]
MRSLFLKVLKWTMSRTKKILRCSLISCGLKLTMFLYAGFGGFNCFLHLCSRLPCLRL